MFPLFLLLMLISPYMMYMMMNNHTMVQRMLENNPQMIGPMMGTMMRASRGDSSEYRTMYNMMSRYPGMMNMMYSMRSNHGGMMNGSNGMMGNHGMHYGSNGMMSQSN